jgi:hypothetical protein
MDLLSTRLGYFIGTFPRLSELEEFNIASMHDPISDIPTTWQWTIPQEPVIAYLQTALRSLAFLFHDPSLNIQDLQPIRQRQLRTALTRVARSDSQLFARWMYTITQDAELLDECWNMYTPNSDWEDPLLRTNIQRLFEFLDVSVGPNPQRCLSHRFLRPRPDQATTPPQHPTTTRQIWTDASILARITPLVALYTRHPGITWERISYRYHDDPSHMITDVEAFLDFMTAHLRQQQQALDPNPQDPNPPVVHALYWLAPMLLDRRPLSASHTSPPNSPPPDPD